MREAMGGALAGRVQPEDDATREARHEVLATLLAAYVDTELPPETTAQIDAHLLGCGRCRREVAMHQSLSVRLSHVMRPAVSGALAARIHAALASAPAVVAARVPVRDDRAVASADGDSAARRRWIVIAASIVAVVATVIFVAPLVRPRATAVLRPAPVVTAAPIPILELVAADFRMASARDLPGRARDLETVRSAVPFTVEPLRGKGLQLVAAWTTDLDGDVAAVLAYKWRQTLLLQYVVSDAWLFRSLPIRGVFAEGRALATALPGAAMLAWSSGQGSSIVVADQQWPALVALHPRAR